MTQAQHPEALRLSAWLQDGTFHRMTLGDAILAGRELRAQHARIAELEAQLVTEAARTAAEKLRADQMSQQHDMQAALNREAREQLAALKAAPAAQAVEPAAGAAQSGTVTYSDGTTATGPGSLPQVSPRQQRAAALIDSVEALLGGANGPTIQLRALLAATPPAQASEAIAEITSANHDAAEFGERGFRILRDFQHLDYGTKLYPHPAPQAQDVQR